MPTSKLISEIELVTKELVDYQESYRQEKKRLIFIEDKIIECKEKIRTLKEELRIKANANDFTSIVDENRRDDINSFRSRLSLLDK